ncbi:Store-operated calcium entry-associated regulatory factor [Purpureocillium lavendulum]|uniref:Store-operated calcium entry-associated regulatory factor n=1 Tax=Purpureocillium lavendulum TaxID=1247861 RepID=A0AB34G7A8_9HYPO|nr:Store-operated calcium entry-associated regulatory factor [Purpureocillium lavendulum]
MVLFDVLAILLALPLLSAAAAARPKNAIRLSDVQTLTLRGHGAKTTHRRVPAAPQLKCVSRPDLCRLFDVDVMRCTNQGSSYGGEDIEWSCVASLPEELELGRTEVVCEGYADADDPYVLKGSCGVEYTLLLTKAGERKYPGVANPRGGIFSNGEGGTDLSAWLFSVVFIAVLGWIVYSACYGNGGNAQGRARRAGGPRRPGGGGGGGGGGWNPGWGPDGDDPPPPYPGSKPSSSSRQQGWTPGFWSGLAGGAAAGYMAGNRNRNGGGQREYGNNGGWGAGPSSPRPSPSSPSSSGGSSTRHESTGFGSTRRR